MLLKLIYFLNVAPRKFYTTFVACILPLGTIVIGFMIRKPRYEWGSSLYWLPACSTLKG